MNSLWNDKDAEKLKGDLLKLRVYTSRLLGKDENLVLHGGGNTSVKIRETNIFGEEEDILYVKGSGWDLATIEAEGFAPVKLKTLLQMAELEELNDIDMVKNQRIAMTNPSAPNPSVEAVLHAIIPHTFVDHTHTDAVVTITNTPGIDVPSLYGDDVLVVPYVMPGFILAQQIYELIKTIDWDKTKCIILEHHGVFTFDDDPKKSYEKMIEVVSRAEDYLEEKGAIDIDGPEGEPANPLELAKLRKNVSDTLGAPTMARLRNDGPAVGFSNYENVQEAANKGPLTPDHIIRTKRVPLILQGDHEKDLADFSADLNRYFNEHNKTDLVQLDQSPRWAIWPGKGMISFGNSVKNIKIIEDITRHTIKAIYQAEQLGGWTPLPESDLFDMEYWSLEQLKLKKAGNAKPMQGKVAVVTGGAGGIGKACVDALEEQGASVAVLDIDPSIKETFTSENILTIICDVTDTAAMKTAINETILAFGGIDLLVSNAGIFPKSSKIVDMPEATWQKSIDINVTSHQRLLQLCIPYLELGIDPAVVIIGSKNVPAPGPGAAAYSVAKAGLTQLVRVAAMELGDKGIRINTIHPNAVYDTAIWTKEVLEARAQHYGLTVEEYKTNNILKVEITSRDVADLTISMLGSTFSKITGAQVPIDGGNERVI